MASTRTFVAAQNPHNTLGASQPTIGARPNLTSRPIPTPQVPSTSVSEAQERDFKARSEMRSRRYSAVAVQSESKTEFWLALSEAMEQVGGFKMATPVRQAIISRALSFGIIQDKKERATLGLSALPDVRMVLASLEKAMFSRLVDLTGNKEIKLDQRTPQLERICRMEKAIVVLEERKAKTEEEEAERVKSQMTEVQSTIKTIAQQKEQRETNRRTIALEVDNLRQSMAKMAQQSSPTMVDAMQAKLARLEAALILLNKERKEQQEDQNSELLKKKLAILEQKFVDLEKQKQVKKSEDDTEALRDKLVVLEDRLHNMVQRKSSHQNSMIAEKMAMYEKQLEMLRSKDNGNPAIMAKMAGLESELKRLASTSFTPAMVNDEETNAMRAKVKALEQTMIEAERKMEAQRKKVDEERAKAAEERHKEELEFREAAKKREMELLKRLRSVEETLSKSAHGPSDSALAQRVATMESRVGQSNQSSDPSILQKMREMEETLARTQKALEEERASARKIMALASESTNSGSASFDPFKLVELMNRDFEAKINAANALMETRLRDLVQKGVPTSSGLSYKELQEKLANIQQQLFDPNTDERTQEKLNIEYEKLSKDLEASEEYKQELVAQREKWRKTNEPINQQALIDVRKAMRAMGDAGVLEVLKKKPELKLLLRTSEQIGKLYESEFNSFTTQRLNLQEARALYANMPNFRREQEKQLQWVESLKNKIESETEKPSAPAPKPVDPTGPKVTIRTNRNAPAGGFLEELKRRAGNQ